MTTLNTSAAIASSSLSAIQVQLSVASANIANADTEGYTAKKASASSTSTAGVGTGVEVAAIVSKVSTLLISQLSSATSETAAAEKLANYLDQLQTAMGKTTSDDETGTSLGNKIAQVETALAALVNTPESTSLASEVVTQLEELTSAITSLSGTVQDLRENADSEIADAVDAANQLITKIDGLNTEIISAKARGASTADLEDQRNQALVQLSEFIEVQSYSGSDGSMKVYATSGQVLVGNSAHLLSFKEASSVTANDVRDGTSGLSAVTIDGVDITDRLSAGSIAALIDLRDDTLPGVQDMLDELSGNLISAFNAVQPGLLTGTDATNIGVSATFRDNPGSLLTDSTGTLSISQMAESFLSAAQGDRTFDAAGTLSTRTTDFASYATEILSSVVSDATAATSRLEVTRTELTTVTSTITSLYGVNVDEETATLSSLEQLYSMASQILAIIQDMFDDLMAAVQ
ncbi:flagellar hook-associated protein FlgK [Roseibium aestuarii]|uniref:Flagellar hook-associated protein 1 n=1 Tax=Roseibium aestuarii TaxID=2600299 RepID=A0ABW4K0L2_9HYPH|nr:flagellar hook-associated protein FlgK [Roseibium aestuarii]